ncbi:Uncharacterized protein TCM_002232 [Theobroma cacao]|uniref:Reverse transcriptase zinc-binding domain-containing protein n=1 Tax=Theobroma cacao TaxID=3641 RepID=A0A061DKQ8_THECC|nr:Uncharacterized protein TCM_002232 [Theobroma cacao]
MPAKYGLLGFINPFKISGLSSLNQAPCRLLGLRLMCSKAEIYGRSQFLKDAAGAGKSCFNSDRLPLGFFSRTMGERYGRFAEQKKKNDVEVPGVDYSAAYEWNEIRHKQVKIEWHRLVWFQCHIPKHALIAWMAALDRLPTKDRLLSWETSISGELSGWKEELHWVVKRLKGNAYVCHIWKERTNRFYGHIARTSSQIYCNIVDAVHLRPYGLKNIGYNSVDRDMNSMGTN